MWKTFKAELKHIFSNKWRLAGFFIMLFIPLTYGFLYINAYWAPFKHVDNLRIAVVSQDSLKKDGKETIAGGIVKSLEKNGVTAGATNIYKYKIVSDQDIKKDPEKAVNSGKYSAIIIIPEGYSEELKLSASFLAAGLKIIPSNHLQNIKDWKNKNKKTLDLGWHKHLKELVNNVEKEFEENKFEYNKIKNPVLIDFMSINNLFEASAKDIQSKIIDGKKNSYDRITFYNSYKHSYLAGEMTNYISNSFSLIQKAIIPLFSEVASTEIGKEIIKKWLTELKYEKDHKIKNISGMLIHKTAPNINNYGFGIAPYFISIALWAGALVMTFVIKNERHIKNQSTTKHYFGKTLLWLFSGWFQSIVLISAIWLQGVDIGWEHQWELYLYALFMSTIFTLTVQGASYTMRYGDIGELIVVIMLVIQLISSSGTFPVEMQNIIFRIINPIVPFSYTIHSLREILWNPNWIIIIKDTIILLIFPVIFISLSLFVNWHFDKRTKKRIDGNNQYKSFEIQLDDL